ncbi:MAG: DUF4177 domain-containing protein [Oscillospiraceae bacterium]|nr:DUF4177 domain-containing protein [Oscillospiraceae bacterium]
MKKFEYRIVRFADEKSVFKSEDDLNERSQLIVEKLNELGANGWELVCVAENRYHLKKEIRL